jgi:hypothetical protein
MSPMKPEEPTIRDKHKGPEWEQTKSYPKTAYAEYDIINVVWFFTLFFFVFFKILYMVSLKKK